MSSNELILSMGAAYRGAMEIFKEVVPRKEKQSALALAILIHAEKNPGISQGELGKVLRRDPMTMSQAIRGLQTMGFIQSQQDSEDRRMKRLTVTKKGKGLGINLEEAENKLMNGLSKEWGKSRLNQFTKDLSEFNEYINRSRSFFNSN